MEKDAHVAQGKPKAKEVAQPPTPSKTEEKEAKAQGQLKEQKRHDKAHPYSGWDRKACTVNFQTHACAMKGGIVS